MAITAWLGIDVAKHKFDVALNWNTRRRAKVFRNDDTAGEFRKRFIWRAVGVIVWETQVLVSGK